MLQKFSFLWIPGIFLTSLLLLVLSVVKESACNAGDPSSIPGLGRSTGEGIGYPLQYSWASLVAQLVKNQLAVQETWARSLGWKDPLEKGQATHSSILAWRIPYSPWGRKSWTQLSGFHFQLGFYLKSLSQMGKL